jgi:hypothetical protein
VLVTVSASPAAPTNLVVIYSGGHINLTWSAATPAAGFGSYQVRQAAGSPGWSTVATGVTLKSWQLNTVYPLSYLFEVRTLDANGAPSPWSQAEVATAITFTDDPLQSGTVVRAVHVAQLRTAIDQMRATAGLPLRWNSNSYTPAGFIAAQDIYDMRQALYEARSSMGLLPMEYSFDPVVYIHAADMTELQRGVE